MQKLLVVSLASLIAMLLCSGVALAGYGNCCMGGDKEDDQCLCVKKIGGDPEDACVSDGGIWVGKKGCEIGGTTLATNPCLNYCTQVGACVPEATTIALLATGLIGMAGYFRLRRKEE